MSSEFVERTAAILDPEQPAGRGAREARLSTSSSAAVEASGGVGGTRVDAALGYVYSAQGVAVLIPVVAGFCLVTDLWGLVPDGRNWRVACRMQHNMWGGTCWLIALGLLRFGSVLRAQLDRIVLRHAGTLEGFRAALRRYSAAFLAVYVLLSALWLVCGLACLLPGVLFAAFYHLQLWLPLYSLFNAAGIIVAAVTFFLDTPARAHAELQLHDLLAYIGERERERGAPERAAAAPKRRAEPAEAEAVAPLTGASAAPVAQAGAKPRWLSHLRPPRGGAAVAPSGPSAPHLSARLSLRSGSGSDDTGYPCYVMRLRTLGRYARIPSHEEALRDGALEVVRADSYAPCRSSCYFISHTWLPNRDGSRTHPDGDGDGPQPKLAWLRERPRSTFLDDAWAEAYVWMDYLSIPQASSAHQRRAIHSLAEYATLCGRFVPLVAGPAEVADYLQRGWCSTECIAALTPKLDGRGQWRIGPSRGSLRFRFYSAAGAPADDEGGAEEARGGPPSDGGCAHCVPISLASVRSPLDPAETSYTDEDDRAHLRGLIAQLAGVMAAYERSGSSAWEHTDDIRNRPGWLRALASPAAETGTAR